MGIFDGILLCSDVDGTLVYENEVPKANAEAIEYFKSEGGLFTLSTGRQPSYFTEKFGIEPNTYVIAINGTVISDAYGKEIIYDQKLSLDFALEVCDFVLPRYNLETYWAADISYDVLEFGSRRAFVKYIVCPSGEKEQMPSSASVFSSPSTGSGRCHSPCSSFFEKKMSDFFVPVISDLLSPVDFSFVEEK